MNTRPTILSLAALATLSLSALAPTQASAWGMHDGYGFGGGHRSTGYFGSSFRHRVWASEPCPTEYAPVIRRHAPRFTEEAPCEHETFEARGYGRERMLREHAPMRQAQGYGPAQQMQGYAPQPRRDLGQVNRRDAYEENQETEAPQQQAAQTQLER
jgi:hypothetical protein